MNSDSKGNEIRLLHTYPSCPPPSTEMAREGAFGQQGVSPLVLGTVDVTHLDGLDRLAKYLADVLAPGDTVLLQGELGAGKTTFTRYVLGHLMGEDTLTPSPTFSLMHAYDTPKGPLWHVDLYRLTPAEVPALGLDEHATNAIMLIEWPQRLSYAPHDPLLILFEGAEHTNRQLSFKGSRRWLERLAALPTPLSQRIRQHASLSQNGPV